MANDQAPMSDSGAVDYPPDAERGGVTLHLPADGGDPVMRGGTDLGSIDAKTTDLPPRVAEAEAPQGDDAAIGVGIESDI